MGLNLRRRPPWSHLRLKPSTVSLVFTYKRSIFLHQDSNLYIKGTSKGNPFLPFGHVENDYL